MRKRQGRLGSVVFLSAALIAGAGVAGCGGAAVRGDVVVAARLPVRTYPTVIIASGPSAHEQELAQRLVGHLSGRGRGEVVLLSTDELEPMRRDRRIHAGSVVLIIALEFREQMRAEWGSRPETVCGPFGCYTTRRNFAYDIPTSRAELSVTMYDGPTAQQLDRVVLSQEDEGHEYAYMRDRMAERLAVRAARLVDTRREEVEVDFCEVDVPAVKRAGALIERGDWTHGRALLERAVEHDSFSRLAREDRACVLYDLALGQRFDPAALRDPETHFASAERSLEHAIRLAPDEDDYRRALAALRHHRREVMRVREQQSAQARNYEVAAFSARVPEPPAAYRDANR